MIKGAAEFYRNFPSKQGRRRQVPPPSRQSPGGLLAATDPINDLPSCERFSLAIKASEVLGIDADSRPAWKAILDDLAPYPMSGEPGAIGSLKPKDGRPTWAMAKEPPAGESLHSIA